MFEGHITTALVDMYEGHITTPLVDMYEGHITTASVDMNEGLKLPQLTFNMYEIPHHNCLSLNPLSKHEFLNQGHITTASVDMYKGHIKTALVDMYEGHKLPQSTYTEVINCLSRHVRGHITTASVDMYEGQSQLPQLTCTRSYHNCLS
ncbi:hypothetical protein Btru_076351 [Bulinus truncatus]|nr:hypothetical protein Btru_076351 [Bulinus truncatus]